MFTSFSSLVTVSPALFFPQVFILPSNFHPHTNMSSLFYPFLLTFLSGLPQIPPGRRTTCHQWRRSTPTTTSTWSRKGDLPPLGTLLRLCRFLTGRQPSPSTPQAIAHNAFQWPVTQTRVWIIKRYDHSCNVTFYLRRCHLYTVTLKNVINVANPEVMQNISVDTAEQCPPRLSYGCQICTCCVLSMSTYDLSSNWTIRGQTWMSAEKEVSLLFASLFEVSEM